MTKRIDTPRFQKDLKKYSSVKRAAETKVSNLLESPMGFGEPLKDDLRGFSSCPVKKSFIIVYVYCRECRLKGYQSIRNCIKCNEIEDETVIFLAFGPHDTAYKEAKKRNLSDEMLPDDAGL
jgi:mRNA-degrading endonuclease YafQ of YafQ-DinJ toxin-antitoxin module